MFRFTISLVLSCLPLLLPAQAAYNDKGQAMPPETQPFGAEAFVQCENTEIRWLGSAGFLINSRGTCLMVDPLLEGFDMPLLIDAPILAESVPHLDGVLVTHSDNDHFSVPTLQKLSAVCPEFHSTVYVDSLMQNLGFPAKGHAIGDTFAIKGIGVKLTPADHLWQNAFGASERVFQPEDYCGFLIYTRDGLVWAPGDSRFLDEFLRLPAPDAIFFDFSDDSWHIGLDRAIEVANAYPDAYLLLSHWGTVDAPQMKAFNADPNALEGRVVNPGRIRILAPGEAFILR